MNALLFAMLMMLLIAASAHMLPLSRRAPSVTGGARCDLARGESPCPLDLSGATAVTRS